MVVDGAQVSHFKLREFENAEGLAMVHATALTSLEQVRRDPCALYGETVHRIVTSAVRTPSGLERRALRHGRTHECGRVARTRAAVPQHTLGMVCRRYFDWVKDDYSDGHVHADNRERTR